MAASLSFKKKKKKTPSFSFFCPNTDHESLVTTEELSGHHIKRYVQEPSFGPSDREYCEILGIQVVDTPAAFQYVKPDTFVFGVHLPHYAWGYALSDHLPGLYIGTDLKSLDRSVAFPHFASY